MQHLDVDLAHRLARGRLDDATAQAWNEHVESCAQCRALLEQERSLAKLLTLDETPEQPEGAMDRVLSRLEHTTPVAVKRRRRLLSIVIVGTLVILGALAGSVYGSFSAKRQREQAARELGISAQVQADVIANLEALVVLQRDPWLTDHYVAAQALGNTIAEGEE